MSTIPGAIHPETVLEYLPKIKTVKGYDSELLRDALFLNLMTPLATSKSDDLVKLMSEKINEKGGASTANFARVTLSNIDQFKKTGSRGTKGH